MSLLLPFTVFMGMFINNRLDVCYDWQYRLEWDVPSRSNFLPWRVGSVLTCSSRWSFEMFISFQKGFCLWRQLHSGQGSNQYRLGWNHHKWIISCFCIHYCLQFTKRFVQFFRSFWFWFPIVWTNKNISSFGYNYFKGALSDLFISFWSAIY